MRALESAINQPRLTFDQTDFYPDILTKAARKLTYEFFYCMAHGIGILKFVYLRDPEGNIVEIQSWEK